MPQDKKAQNILVGMQPPVHRPIQASSGMGLQAFVRPVCFGQTAHQSQVLHRGSFVLREVLTQHLLGLVRVIFENHYGPSFKIDFV